MSVTALGINEYIWYLKFLVFYDSAFGDSDADDNDNDQDNHNDNDQEIPDAVIPIPPACRPRAGLAPPPFDMMEFMHGTSSYDMQKVFRLADSMPVIPVHIPCERPGGDARRAILKARAANVPRSVSEVFALVTSRTISAEDTAVILETFGNVRYKLHLDIVTLRYLLLHSLLILLCILILHVTHILLILTERFQSKGYPIPDNAYHVWSST